MRYRYAPRLLPMLLVVVFFGAFLSFYAYRAFNNRRGVIINHIVELGPGGASVFYGVLATLSAGFVLIGLWALLFRMLRKTYLVFDDRGLSVPSRWTKSIRLLPYASVQNVELLSVRGQRFLHIATESEKITISGIMLQSDELLREVGVELTRRLKKVDNPHLPPADPSA